MTKQPGEIALEAYYEARGLSLNPVFPHSSENEKRIFAAVEEAVLASARPSPGDPVRAGLEGALQPLFDDAKHDLEQATHAGDGGGIRYAVIRKIALEQAMDALRAALSISTPTGEGEAEPQIGWECSIKAVSDPNGKRWRLVGTNFDMQPIGEISADEAKALCQQIVSALAHPQQGGERDASKHGGAVMTEWWANVYVYTHVDHGKFCEGAQRRLSRFRAECEAEEALDRNRFRIHVRLKPVPNAPNSASKSSGEEA